MEEISVFRWSSASASGFRHPSRLLARACRRKRGKARQVDGAPATFGALLMAIGLVALWGSGAEAARITFEPSNQSITFTGNEANSVTVSSPTLSGSAVDTPTVRRIVRTYAAILYGRPQSGGIFSCSKGCHQLSETVSGAFGSFLRRQC
jgi:hypothetical protein